jgi:class 3 adenylate cyclase
MNQNHMNFKSDLTKKNHRVNLCLMVVDLVESTYFKYVNAAADWRGSYDVAFHAILEEVVTKKLGTLVKFLGDGFMFAFTTETGDPEDNCIRAAVNVQRRLRELRDQATVSTKMQFRISAGLVEAHELQVTIDGVPQARDFLGEDVDTVFRLNGAIAANGIAINSALEGDIRWRSMGKELDLLAEDGKYPKFLGKIALKGLPPTEAHEVGWADRYFGLATVQRRNDVGSGDGSRPSVDPQAGFTPNNNRAAGGTRYDGVGLTTSVGHVYNLTTAGTSCWIEMHSPQKEQLICVFANIVRAEPPDMGEVVCFVPKPGQPNRKAMQVLRSGTGLQGKVVAIEGNTAKVKVDEFAARDHSPFDVHVEGAPVKQNDRVDFTLMIENQDGRFVAIGRHGKLAGT